jgi:hypothetical protein
VTEGIIDALKMIPNIVPVAVIPRSGRLLNGGTKLLCVEKSSSDAYRDLILSEFVEMKSRKFVVSGSVVTGFMNAD